MSSDPTWNAGDGMEMRLTALLLGELPEEDAAALRRAMEQDTHLAALHDRLKQAIDLVRETTAVPAGQTAAQPEALKLSGERRQKLLARFKTVAPKEFAATPRRERSWILPMSIAAAVVALVGIIVVSPNTVRSRTVAQLNSIENNLRRIEGGKDQWALEHKKGPGDTPTPAELADYFKGSPLPRSVAGETYQINPLGTPAAPALPKQGEKPVVIASSAAPREDVFTYNSPNQSPPSSGPTPVSPRASAPPVAPTPKAQRTEIILPSGGKPADAEKAQLEARIVHSDPNRFMTNQAIGSAFPLVELAQSSAGTGGGGGFGGGGVFDLTRRGAQLNFLRADVAGGVTEAQPTEPARGDSGRPTAVPNGEWVSGLEVAGTRPNGPANLLVGRNPNPAAPRQSFTNEGQLLASTPQKSPSLGDLSALGPTLRPGDVATEIATRTPFGLTPRAPAPTAGDDLSKWNFATTNAFSDDNLSKSPAPAQGQNAEVLRMGIRAEGQAQKMASALSRTGAVAEASGDGRLDLGKETAQRETKALGEKLTEQDQWVAGTKRELERLQPKTNSEPVDAAPPRATATAPVPQPEFETRDNPFSTFSLNVADVSFKLAAASLEKGALPEPASVRSEEFINAFDYRDPEPAPGVPIGFVWERARYPFAHNRDLLRFSIKTAAAGRQPGRPLNLVLLLDNSGSMERADRVRIIHEALRLLAAQLQPEDKFSVITFARTAQLRVDGIAGDQAGVAAEQLSGLNPQGGTNLEEAMNLAYQTALRHYLAGGINRVILLTDGAANLGNVDPESLKQKVEAHRKQGIALDCFGIGWEGYNDDLLENLSRNGDGRYGFLNTPEETVTEFAGQLAGALHVAASDVKVQVEFNPARVTAYRQIGYAKHQLTKEQFRDNTVDAAEIGAAESGNALYVIEVNPAGQGPLAVVRVRCQVPGTADYPEHEWVVPYTGQAPLLEQSGAAMRLAATAGAFSEWLVSSPHASEVSPDRLLGCLAGVPDVYGADGRPKKLEWMIRQAKSISGK